MARTSATQKIGTHIKQLRVAANLTQEKLGIATGLSQTYISGIESGQRNPSVKTLDKIARALGISLSDLTDFNYRLHDRSRISRHL